MISGPIPAGSPRVMPISGRGDGCFMSMVLSLGLDDIKGQYTIGKKKSKYNFCYGIVKLLLDSDYKIHLIFIKFEDIKSKSKRIGGIFF